MKKEFEVVTLCGSAKFKNEFLAVQKKLTLEGKIVLSVEPFSHVDLAMLDEETVEMFTRMQRRKIDISDSIYVINKGGYIDNDTENEIVYAFFSHKHIALMDESAAATATLDEIQKDSIQLILSSKSSVDMVFESYGFHLNEIPEIIATPSSDLPYNKMNTNNMKRLYVAYGTDKDESGGGYGGEAHLIYANSIEEARSLVPKSLTVEEVERCIKDTAKSEIMTLYRGYD